MKPLKNFLRTKAYRENADKSGFHILWNADLCLSDGLPGKAYFGYAEFPLDEILEAYSPLYVELYCNTLSMTDRIPNEEGKYIV